MAKAKAEELRLFIKSVHFKGFKSIDDLAIDLKEGLNIVIGKNASGKSNFLECLANIISAFRGYSIPFKYSQIEFYSSDGSDFLLNSEREILTHNSTKEHFEEREGVKESFFINGKALFKKDKNESELSTYKFKNKEVFGHSVVTVLMGMSLYNIYPLHVKFNLPDNLDLLLQPGTINILNIENDFPFWQSPKALKFVLDLFWKIELHFNQLGIQKLTKASFQKQLKIPESIKENLKKLTPIQDVRFNENVILYKTDKQIIIENLKIDFKVNGNWLPWSQLSDGTKRLFYMVAEITNQRGGLVLVEEPELGIHPHQFHLIMNFLKEESENKQIVISTHSPQALNALEENELDNILISYYDLKKGSKIKRLTIAQKNKAKKYINEVGFLSDYWMLSDLES